MLLVLAVAALGAVIVWVLEKRGLMTFSTQEVQAYSQKITYGVPTWLKATVIALIVLRLVLSLSYIAVKPYNADEVRGFYRLSGYYEEQVKEDAFRGQILTAQDLKAYQTPSDNKTFGDTLTALATSPEHTPGYYAISWVWLKLWSNPLSARILSVLLGAIALPWAYWLCLELFNSALAGWIAVGLLNLSPYHILLSQGARQYSLLTLAILASSVFLLRALRTRKALTWMAYAISVAVGLYAHLFFGFILLSHGLYVVIFGRKQLLAFGMATGAGILAFAPWLWVIFSSLNKLDENTQGAQGRNSSLFGIIRFTRSKLGDIFFNLNNSSSIERLADPLFFLLIALAFYCLLRCTPGRVWSFLLLPVVINYGLLVPPDLLLGGERSLRSRYLLTALLCMTLAVASFLANAISRSKYGWERTAATGVLIGLIVCGLASSVTVTRAFNLDYLEEGRTASVVNQELAPLINTSENPLVVSAATHSFALALSHEVNDNVNFQLVQDLDPDKWETTIDLSGAEKTYSDVFVYFPNEDFLTFLETAYNATLEPVFEKRLYRLATTPSGA
ncbi:MAG: glycosyltransferase family 39 protein [Leptolyngbyaceae cyanobacterium MAG.088]|nr:glycosyltransferase family 39 protein [Leptolyngbyaceae cyanobacterium MAG.088]